MDAHLFQKKKNPFRIYSAFAGFTVALVAAASILIWQSNQRQIGEPGRSADASILGINSPSKSSKSHSSSILGIEDESNPTSNNEVVGFEKEEEGDQKNQPSRPDDPDHLVLALRYVSYLDDEGTPVVSDQEAGELLNQINGLYQKCNMSFQIEEFMEVVPEDYGLDHNPSRMSDLTKIRQQFDNPSQIVIINTGDWNSAGGLGADGANAWTTLPGNSPSGAVIEKIAAKHPELVAHEIGHYLSLGHNHSTENLMYPVIYRGTTFSDSQCEAVRSSALTDWQEVLR